MVVVSTGNIENKDRNLDIIELDSLGYFRKEIPKNTKFEISAVCTDYYTKDTIIHLGTQDEIVLSFEVFPKMYSYTKQQAEKDLKNGLVQIIIYDSLLYESNKEANYTSQYGFDYQLEAKPIDYEFKQNIYLYNRCVKEFLHKKDVAWKDAIATIEDSLFNMNPNYYGINTSIDMNSLFLPRQGKLPEKMLKEIKEKKSEFESTF